MGDFLAGQGEQELVAGPVLTPGVFDEIAETAVGRQSQALEQGCQTRAH